MKIEDEVKQRFRFQAVAGAGDTTAEINQAMKRIHAKAEALAMLFVDLLPESRERSSAISRLQESVLWADACVQQNGVSPKGPA